MIPTLRPYQNDTIERIRILLRRGTKRVLLVAPTGSGKTIIASDMIRAATAKGSRTLFLAHRRELIDQTSDKLDLFGVPHGVIMANHPRWRPQDPVQVASRDTMVRRLEKHDWGDFNLIVQDEAHHAPCDSNTKILQRWPNATVIGLTATPWRLDGKGLGGGVFQDLVVAATVKQLTSEGYLVPVEGFAYDVPDLRDVGKSHSDYRLELLGDVMRETVLGGSIIRDYLEHARGKRALAFAVNVEHSQALVSQARAAGIPAEHVDANTPKDLRKAILGQNGRLAAGETLLVGNCMIATEGLDIPAVEIGILARPTASLALAMQMMGRILRPSPGKSCARIHDHAGILLDPSIGLPDADRTYSLTEDRAPDAAPTKTCPKCRAIVPASTRICPRCGEPFPLDGRGVQRDRSIREDDKIGRLTIDEIRSRRPGDVRVLTDRELRKVQAATREERAAEYLRLVKVQQDKGFKPGFIGRCYRDIWGVWPKFSDEELADVVPATRPFLRLIKHEDSADAEAP